MRVSAIRACKVVLWWCLIMQWVSCSTTEPQAYINHVTLQQGSFQQLIHSEGELVPVDKTTLQVPRRLWGTLEFLVPEGTVVKKGEEIARISTRQFTERVGRYLSSMETSQANMREKELRLPLEKLSIVEKEKTKAHAAELKSIDETKVRQGPREDERKRVEVEEQKARLQASAVPLREKQALQTQGYVSRQEVDSTRQTLLQQQTLAQQAALKQAQQTTTYRQPDIEKARLETRGAELEHKITRLEGVARESLLRTQQLSAKSRAASLGRRVRSIEDRLDNASMKAPFAGTVIYPRIWGDRVPYIGMEVYNGLPIVQVARTDHLEVHTRIHEFDIPNVKVGQSVTLKSRGVPVQELKGTVKKIQKLGKYKDETNPVGLKYFDVEIELVPAAGDAEKTVSETLRPHTQLDVVIEAERLPSVWSLPVEYVRTEKDTAYVWQKTGNTYVKKTVNMTASNGERAVLTGTWTGEEMFALPEDMER